MASKQNLIKRNVPFIDRFDHQGPAVIHKKHDLTVGVLKNLDITSDMEIDKRINYTHIILRGTALKKYKQVLAGYKESEMGLSGDQWNMGAKKDVTMEQLWAWDKVDSIDGSE